MLFGAALTKSRQRSWTELDQAEDYLNERLAANGEFWRLNSNTRVLLGLPPRLNSPDEGRKSSAGRP